MKFNPEKFNLKVGDLVLAYHNGIHRIDKIERRFYSAEEIQRYPTLQHFGYVGGDEYPPLVSYTQVLTKDFKKSKKKTNQCDASFCRKVDENYIDNLELEYKNNINTLRLLTSEDSN